MVDILTHIVYCFYFVFHAGGSDVSHDAGSLARDILHSGSFFSCNRSDVKAQAPTAAKQQSEFRMNNVLILTGLHIIKNVKYD